MSERVTRQGVRDLNPRGFNGNRNHKATCRHHFGPSIVIGTRYVYDEDYFCDVAEHVYGRQCFWCKEIREER